MSNIKIFVTHTSNQNSICFKHPLFYHVIAGSKFLQSAIPEGMYADCTGTNISEKNKSYCELTTQYWAWKNQDADYYGFCHYRRFFSFSDKHMPQSDCGCLIRPVINRKFMAEMELDEKTMRRQIESNDFLIAEGIPTKVLHAKNVYEHYQNAEGLHIKDVEILLSIIREKYPELLETAESYFNGNKFYPCNMFIMKKELFYEYSEILFDVLGQFEKRADLGNYSREGLRTPGHLGERMAGIYYEYLKKRGDCRLKELQMVMVEHTDASICIHTNEVENVIPIVFMADQKHASVLFVCIKSMVENITNDHNYVIYIFHTDIKKDSQASYLEELQKENITIHFVDITVKRIEYESEEKRNISTETLGCFLIMDLLKEYHKVLYLDYNMIIKRDIADLYDVELGKNLLAGILDIEMIGRCCATGLNTAQNDRNILDMYGAAARLQMGILVLNVKELNRKTSVQELLLRTQDEKDMNLNLHVLDSVCEGKVAYLNQAWNLVIDSRETRWNKAIKSVPYYLLDEYESARKNPFIIHYLGDLPPWHHPSGDFGREFWKVARGTVFYEELLEMIGDSKLRQAEPSKFVDRIKGVAKRILPQGSWVRCKAINLYLKFREG